MQRRCFLMGGGIHSMHSQHTLMDLIFLTFGPDQRDDHNLAATVCLQHLFQKKYNQ